MRKNMAVLFRIANRNAVVQYHRELPNASVLKGGHSQVLSPQITRKSRRTFPTEEALE